MRIPLLQLLAILSLGLLSACSSDLNSGFPIDIPVDSRAIEFVYELPAQSAVKSRKSEIGTSAESAVYTLEAYLFDEYGNLIRKFKVGDGLQILDKTKIRLLIAQTDAYQYTNRKIKLIVVGNYSEEFDVEFVTDLQDRLLYTNFNEENPKSLIMTGLLELDEINWNQGNLTFEVHELLKLNRAAAKVQFHIQEIDVFDNSNSTNVHYELVGSPEVRFINYSSYSSLIPNSQNKEFELSSTEYIELINRGVGYTLPADYYSYESDWTASHGFNAIREAHLMLKLVFKAKNSSGVYGEEKEYFYHIPINYRFPTAEMSKEQVAALYKIQRNHLYRIISSIHQLGSEDEGEPFVLASEISVEQWVTHTIDGNIDTAHFLMVKEKSPMMPNIDRLQLDYQSSLPIAITDMRVEYTYYDRDGKAESEVDNNPNELRIGVDENLKYIDIYNPIPTNFVPLNIYFTVRHESGSNLSEDIHIIQYPPKYVTAMKSTGYVNSTLSDPYADFRFHDVLGAMSRYSPQINDVFYKITTLVNSDGEYIGDPTSPNGSTKKDGYSNRFISPQFIIATQHGLSVGVKQYEPATGIYWQSISFDGRYGPVDGYSRRLPYSSNSRRDNTASIIAYRTADERCANYFEGEYGMDGFYTEYYKNSYGRESSRKVYKQFKYQGKWRLPTLAELAYIDNIQDNSYSVVKSLLWGSFYWSAQKNMAYSFNGNTSASVSEAHVRCVFDTWKLENHD